MEEAIGEYKLIIRGAVLYLSEEVEEVCLFLFSGSDSEDEIREEDVYLFEGGVCG